MGGLSLQSSASYPIAQATAVPSGGWEAGFERSVREVWQRSGGEAAAQWVSRHAGRLIEDGVAPEAIGKAFLRVAKAVGGEVAKDGVEALLEGVGYAIPGLDVAVSVHDLFAGTAGGDPRLMKLEANMPRPRTTAPRTAGSNAAVSDVVASRRAPAPARTPEPTALPAAQQQRIVVRATEAAQARFQRPLQTYETRLGQLERRASALIDAGVERPGVREHFAQAAKALDAVEDRSRRLAVLQGAQALFSASPRLSRIVDPSTGETFDRKTLRDRLATVTAQLDGAARRFVAQVAVLEGRLDPMPSKPPGDVPTTITGQPVPLSGRRSAGTSVPASSPPVAPAAALDSPAKLALRQVADALRRQVASGAVPADAASQARLLRQAVEAASAGQPGATPKARIEHLLGALGIPPELVWTDAAGLGSDRFASDPTPGDPVGGDGGGGTEPSGSPGGGGPPGNPHIRTLVLTTIALAVIDQIQGIPAAVRLALDVVPWGGHGSRTVEEAARLGEETRLLLQEGETLGRDGRILRKDGSALPPATLEARRAERAVTRDGHLVTDAGSHGEVGTVEEAAGDMERTLHPGEYVKVGKRTVAAKALAERVSSDFEARLNREAETFHGSAAEFRKRVDLPEFADDHLGKAGTGDESLQAFRKTMMTRLQDRLDAKAFDRPPPPGTMPPGVPAPVVGAAQATQAERALEQAAPGVVLHDVRVVDGVVTARVGTGWFGQQALTAQQVGELDKMVRLLEHSPLRMRTIATDIPVRLTPEVPPASPLYVPRTALIRGDAEVVTKASIRRNLGEGRPRPPENRSVSPFVAGDLRTAQDYFANIPGIKAQLTVAADGTIEGRFERIRSWNQWDRTLTPEQLRHLEEQVGLLSAREGLDVRLEVSGHPGTMKGPDLPRFFVSARLERMLSDVDRLTDRSDDWREIVDIVEEVCRNPGEAVQIAPATRQKLVDFLAIYSRSGNDRSLSASKALNLLKAEPLFADEVRRADMQPFISDKVRLVSGLGQGVDDIVARSPTLQKQLRKLKAGGWLVKVDDARYSTSNESRKLIVLRRDALANREFGISQISHEVGHALDKTNYGPPGFQFDLSSKENFLRSAMKGEGRALLNEWKIRDEIRRNSGTDINKSFPSVHNFYQDVFNDYNSGKISEGIAVERLAEVADKPFKNDGWLKYYEQLYDDYIERTRNEPSP